MRVGSGVILFQLAGFLTSALADFYFAKHTLWVRGLNLWCIFLRLKINTFLGLSDPLT